MNWKRVNALLAGALALPLVALSIPKGFEPLFNGKDLTGWWGLKTENPALWMNLSPEDLSSRKKQSLEDIQKHWRVENGVLVNDGKGLYLTTDQNYGDFELLLEYKTVAQADSGIYLRGIPQVQIWDSTEEKKFKWGADKGSGGLWNNPKGAKGKDPLVLADKPFGEWNSMRIRMVGSYVTIHLNDKLVVDHARLHNYFNRTQKPPFPIPPRGPIQLQTHGGEISWRNIYLREIDGKEANRILTDAAFKGGHTPEWQGALDNYTLENGTIQCRKGKGGTLFSKKEYADFTVQFEFQLPPGGNNGLAIRYPGTGNPAYSAMCELQVLDNTAKKYGKLDPRQYHASAYGMVAAHRGYLRPVGEWNFQSVEVVGSTIKVELNGTRILDADLSTITEFMKGQSHSGRSLKKGYFGFAGHNDPVVFRNVKIKELINE